MQNRIFCGAEAGLLDLGEIDLVLLAGPRSPAKPAEAFTTAILPAAAPVNAAGPGLSGQRTSRHCATS